MQIQLWQHPIFAGFPYFLLSLLIVCCLLFGFSNGAIVARTGISDSNKRFQEANENIGPEDWFPDISELVKPKHEMAFGGDQKRVEFNPAQRENVYAKTLELLINEMKPKKAKKMPYDERLARKMMGMAASAYARTDQTRMACVNNTLVNGANDDNDDIASDDWHIVGHVDAPCDHMVGTCSFVAVKSARRRQIVVAFRGTIGIGQLLHEIKNAVMDHKARFYGMGEVNFYFANALNSLWPPLTDILADAHKQKYQAIFTGHSLGGALASLAAAKSVIYNLFQSDQIHLYTLGMPRIGGPQYAARHDQLVPNSYRIVNAKDIVPHLPLCHNKNSNVLWWTMWHSLRGTWQLCYPDQSYYYHHGMEIWYKNGFGMDEEKEEKEGKEEILEEEGKSNGTNKNQNDGTTVGQEGRNYRVCSSEPTDEDRTCSNGEPFSLANLLDYLYNHKHYFGHKVSAFGKLGCEPGQEHLEELEPDPEADAVSDAMARNVFLMF